MTTNVQAWITKNLKRQFKIPTDGRLCIPGTTKGERAVTSQMVWCRDRMHAKMLSSLSRLYRKGRIGLVWYNAEATSVRNNRECKITRISQLHILADNINTALVKFGGQPCVFVPEEARKSFEKTGKTGIIIGYEIDKLPPVLFSVVTGLCRISAQSYGELMISRKLHFNTLLYSRKKNMLIILLEICGIKKRNLKRCGACVWTWI